MPTHSQAPISLSSYFRKGFSVTPREDIAKEDSGSFAISYSHFRRAKLAHIWYRVSQYLLKHIAVTVGRLFAFAWMNISYCVLCYIFDSLFYILFAESPTFFLFQNLEHFFCSAHKTIVGQDFYFLIFNKVF